MANEIELQIESKIGEVNKQVNQLDKSLDNLGNNDAFEEMEESIENMQKSLNKIDFSKSQIRLQNDFQKKKQVRFITLSDKAFKALIA